MIDRTEFAKALEAMQTLIMMHKELVVGFVQFYEANAEPTSENNVVWTLRKLLHEKLHPGEPPAWLKMADELFKQIEETETVIFKMAALIVGWQ